MVEGGKERLKSDSDLQAHDVQSITGRGVKAVVDGQPVYIGKESLFAKVEGTPLPDALRASVQKLKASGRTTMIVRRGDTYLGVLGLMDTPREAARNVISQLRVLGIQRMIMLSGDVALMADDLNHLPFVVGLSRQTSRIIRQNLWLSLGMVAFLVPASVLGLRLGVAVVLHEGSTLLVVLNALRLLAYQAK